MADVDAEAIELHAARKGKLEVRSKVPLRNRKDLSLAYTPGVAAVCLKIASEPELAYTYTIKQNSVAVVTDGSAVLGLGNIGARAAMPVMEGKCVLFKELAGIDAFPICLDVHEPEEIISIAMGIAPSFGGINLEDIAAPKCFEIESVLKQELDIPVMHDDQHGTAIVVIAGLINALKVVGKDKADVSIVVSGAGAAGITTARLLVTFGVGEVVLVDTKGAVYEGRNEGMNPAKTELAAITNRKKKQGQLADVIREADVFVGLSAPNVLTADMVRSMNSSAIVFAMANPVPEIMPDAAKSAGAAVVATGRSDFPNQINNSLAFPGIFRGALDSRAREITEGMKLAAAEAIASLVKPPKPEFIIPEPLDAAVVPAVAKAVAQSAVKDGAVKDG